MAASDGEGTPLQIKLVHDLLDKYDKKAKPIWDNHKAINVSFSMDLYQILELVRLAISPGVRDSVPSGSSAN